MPSSDAREGSVDVPGASLRYRLVGRKSALPTLVFENGWAASYHYWAWMERELAPHAQLLFYNRAGIGGSTLAAPPTAQGTSDHFEAMLVALKIDQPVIVVGQSYGGLMCALHGALKPHCLRGFVQVDNTPEVDHALIDKQLGLFPILTFITRLFSRVGLPDPIFGQAARLLPPKEGALMMQTSFRSSESMRNALVELKMIHDFRAAIARAAVRTPPPRLVISAGVPAEIKGAIVRALISPKKARAVIEVMQGLHRTQAGKNGRWTSLPFAHGDLVFTEAGARATAAAVLEFATSLR